MENCIEGKNAVTEALLSGRKLEKILLVSEKGERDDKGGKIMELAKEKGVFVQFVPRTKLDNISETKNHQGAIAVASPIEYADIDDILENARSKGEPPFIVILDHVYDPYNLGAVIRTAEAAGAHGVIIPARRASSVTPVVEKAAAGAVSYVPIAKVPNISGAVERLKKEGVWIYCAVMDGKTIYETDLTGPAAVVIGQEGSGVSELVRRKCDFEISIPMFGKITSLNASVSAGVVLYEAVRQRKSGNC